MAAVNVTFPGNLAQVKTAADLRSVPSTLLPLGALFLVNGLEGLFEYDPGSLAADDGKDVLRPVDKTPGQVGRWIRNVDGLATGPEGPTGPANSTYTSLAALKAAPQSNRSYILADGNNSPVTYAYVAGDFTGRADDVNVVKLDAVPLTTGALVRQTAASVSYSEPGSTAVPIPAQQKMRLAVGVAPEGYGAKGDGVTDDTAALQRALSSGRSIQLSQGATYLVSSRLLIAADGVTLSGGGTIKVAPTWDFAADTDVNGTHLRVLFVTGAFVTIDGVTFDMTGVTPGTAVENGFIWSTAISTKVTGCQFTGCTKGTCVWGLANAPYMAFVGCSVINCTGAVFVKGRNCVIADNIIINATDAAIAINGRSCVGTTVTGNSIANEQLAAIPSMIAAEEGASRWTISGNTLTGVNGGGISALNVLDNTQVQGGTIQGNVVDGANFNGARGLTDNPATLISISDTYTDTIITGNVVSNPPLGNGNTRAVLIPATGTVFADNIVDGSASPNISALIGIFAGFGGIDIRDNRTNAGTNVRHFLFTPGSYGNAPCSFRGGKFYGGSEGINAELNVASIGALILQIHDLADTNLTNIVAAPTILGDRATYMNAGAWAYPHRIGPRTEMFCTGNPSEPGRMPFQNGDRFHYLDTVAAGAMTIIKTQGGSPWTKYGGVV